MEPRGRGRGYARGRGQPGQQPQRGGGPQQPQRPGQGPPQQAQGGQGAPPASAWPRPMQPTAWPRPQTQAAGGPQEQFPQVVGRGARQEQEQQGAISRRVMGEGDAGGNEGGTRGGGNGVRGRVTFTRGDTMVTRPANLATKKGTIGTPINLLSNYFPLIQNGKWCLYQYRVDLNPDIDNTGRRKFLVRTATRELFNGGYLFDGTVLYTPQRIPNDTTELFVTDEQDGQNIRITIRLVGDVAWGDPHYIQLFNIIIRKCLALMGLQQVGRNYYMPDAQITLSEHKIQLWPGYFTSMRQHERDILLNVDLQFKFMRTDNVYDILLECQGANVRKEFQSKVIGSVVLTFYNNKTYKVDDVDFSVSPNDTFKKSDGTEITYKDYYSQKYRVQIRNPNQPMLLSRSKAREIRAGMPETVYLVPELCQLTGLTDRQRENFNLMKALATHTRIGVEGRIRKLMEFSQRIHQKPEVLNEIRRWDLNIANRLVQYQGRVLPMESMVGGNDARYPAGPQADWTRDLRSKQMFHAPQMARLAVVCPNKFRNGTQDLIQTLGKAAGGMRWSIGQPKIFEIPDDRSGTYIEKIDQIISSAQPTLILVILPNNSQDRYSAIKKKCYVDRGVPTQMFVARNLTNKGIMSIATKVAIQMNCKIGGAPWSVTVPLSGLMVVGYDVCRDTANKRKSFSGMVSSLDRQITRYYSCAMEHQMEEELSNNFGAYIILACKQYKKNNGAYPEKILIYRDGVGEGQLPYVFEHELENIKKKLKSDIYNGAEPKLAFIVVSKRINTRIFTEKDNPPPGTVVDDVITLPNRYDFYIVSQCVRQGTVSPTSYNVIWDSMGLPAERLQLLTYKLTHMYFNWSGTVRVPAPCQYAHKLAFMVSQNLHRPAHPDLENVLYYL